ncbi:MAG: aromatic amino acid ammonia-lyase [Pseudomonadota bacterium]
MSLMNPKNRTERYDPSSASGDHRRSREIHITLDGHSLSIDLIDQFLKADQWWVAMAPQATDALTRANQQLRRWVKEGTPIYGVTRGLGPLKDKVLTESEEEEFQRRILISHATGFGEVFRDHIATLSLLLRANAACGGNFGIRPELVQRMLDLVNAEVIPQMPIYGSLGSGDLQPMASLGLALSGDPFGAAKWKGEVGAAPEILSRAGLEPRFQLQTEEALSIISGSTVLAAGAVCAFTRLRRQVQLLDAAYAVVLEAVRGEIGALDPRVHEARGIPGQIESASFARKMLRGSGWTTPEGRRCLGEEAPRVQDAVSLRSSAHIHGALRETLRFAGDALEREINAATMNPLMFPTAANDSDYDVLMCGNYDGSYLAHLLDFMNIALTDCAGLSMSRSARLISPHASYGLPVNLTGGQPGLNSGLVQIHSLQVSILGQMRQQASPASIHSLSAKDMQEDHNSMGNSSLYDLLLNVDRADTIIAAEFLLATQAIALIESDMKGLPLGEGTRLITDHIRAKIDPPGEDRFFRADLEQVRELVHQDVLLSMVEDL